MCQFPKICKKVMAIDWCQNFVFCSISWEQIGHILHMHMHLCLEILGRDCYASILRKSKTELWALIDIRTIRFHSISWEQIYGIWPNITYALLHVLTTSRLGLSHINFHEFITELWSFIDVRLSFPYNIFRTNWQNLTKFCKWIDVDNIYKRVMALNWCQNFVSAQYHESKLMEFVQFLHMHLYWEGLEWDHYRSARYGLIIITFMIW